MKLLLVFALLAYAEARKIEYDPCVNAVVINNVKYDKEILMEDVESPYQLAIDYDTNTLFFSHNKQIDGEVFASSYLELKTNKNGIIKGISGGFANAVDNKKHKVYLGGRDGIYEFSYVTKKAKDTEVTNDNIWQMFYKDGLYYSNYPDEKVYLYKNGVVKPVAELANTRAMLIAVDNNYNLVYENSSGLFVYDRETDKIFNLGDYSMNSITANIDGNLYFSTSDAAYYISPIDQRIEKLFTMDNIYGLAIDTENNYIVALSDRIVRLKSTNVQCFPDKQL